MNTNTRESFENRFPMPNILEWNEMMGTYYLHGRVRRDSETLRIAERYRGQWRGWRACTAEYERDDSK